MTRALVALLACVGASGCFTFRADLPGALREPAPREDIVVVGHFDYTITHTYFLYGLVNAPPRDLFKEPMRKAVEESGADGMANIIVDTKFSFTDVVLDQVTLGIVAPRTYRMRADLVRLSSAPLPGKPLLPARGRRPRVEPEATPPPLDPPAPLPHDDAPSIDPSHPPLNEPNAPPPLLGAP